MMMLQLWMLQAQLKMKEFFQKENGDVNIVSIVVLIGIAVLLAVVFKDRIGDLVDTLFDAIEGNATGVVNNEISN